MENNYEKVHTMTDYYDGPRGGIANFNGSPVIYDSEFADIVSKEADTFLIQCINEEVFQRALEDWQIWLRWERAFEEGVTSLDTHPALPEDRERHTELATILEDELKIDETVAIRVRADFKYIDKQLFVRWILVDENKTASVF